MENKLIKCEPLKVSANFKEKALEIAKKKDIAKNMVVSIDNFKEVTKMRAALNKEAKADWENFKEVRDALLTPWNAIEDEYKKSIKATYAETDVILAAKIKEIDDGLRLEKEKVVVDYFEKLKEENSLDFLSFEDTKINVTRSKDIIKLEQSAKDFVESIKKDIELIAEEPFSTEMMIEYKENLDCSGSILTVKRRHEKIEKQKAVEREVKEAFEKKKAVEEREEAVRALNHKVAAEKEKEALLEMKATPVDTDATLKQKQVYAQVTMPDVADDIPKEKPVAQNKIYSKTINIRGTKEQMLMLKDFLKFNNFYIREV